MSVDKATGTRYTGGVCQLRYDLPDAVRCRSISRCIGCKALPIMCPFPSC